MISTPAFERIGHRGIPRLARENTMPGFLLALKHGADAVELDVHCAASGEVVVHHDPDVLGHAIATTPWSVLRDLDLGNGERIPTLVDVLTTIGPRATVYVEVKGVGSEEPALDVVRRHGQRVALHSFDHAAIERVARHAPDVPRGVLLDRDTPHAVDAMRAAVARTDARDVWPHWSLVDPLFMAAAAQLDRRVICWTVNAMTSADRLRRLGVAGVCTDDVRLLANL